MAGVNQTIDELTRTAPPRAVRARQPDAGLCSGSEVLRCSRGDHSPDVRSAAHNAVEKGQKRCWADIKDFDRDGMNLTSSHVKGRHED
jgi:hypothetical protein